MLKLNAEGTALLYATYLGGSDNDYAYGLAIDALGTAYITGITESTDFPATDSLQTKSRGGVDAFIAKLDSTGSRLEYSTYLGGSGPDEAVSIAVDRAGNAYVTGETGSKDFPTLNAFQPEQAKGKCVNALDQTICYDAFVTKLSADGRSLGYSTYLGGDDHSSHASDSGRGIAVDGDGNAIVVGETASENFPTVNALQPHLATQGCNGNLQFGCSDAFVAKLSSSGSSLVYSTYLGGNMPDGAAAVAVDSEGNAYVTGDTWSVDFPVYRALQPLYHPQPGGPGPDAFVCKIDPAGSSFFYSTYLGGHDVDKGQSIAVDAAGNAYIAGETWSCDFPAEHAWQPRGDITVYFSQCFDAFLAKIVPDGSALVFSTPLGGRGSDSASGVAADLHGNAYVTGSTASADFPLSRPLLQNSRYPGTFVIKISDLPQEARESNDWPLPGRRLSPEEHLDYGNPVQDGRQFRGTLHQAGRARRYPGYRRLDRRRHQQDRRLSPGPVHPKNRTGTKQSPGDRDWIRSAGGHTRRGRLDRRRHRQDRCLPSRPIPAANYLDDRHCGSGTPLRCSG